MNRYIRIPALLAPTLALLPLGSTWNTASAAAVKAVKYKGPLVAMRWGPVQATITVKGKKITGVKIYTLPENSRSQFIDQQAVPLLKQETLQAQSAKIDSIGGATMTSDAYIHSLQAAVQKAHM